MRTYLLLRNNRQSGPHSLEELLALGLKAQDLIWVDGHSASWRYPSEFDEFRAIVAPPVGEPVVINEFTDAQNRILEAYPAEPEQPIHRDIPPVYQQPLRPLDFHGGVSVDMAREADAPFELGVLPAFQAFASLMEDEDMPTIALYQPLKPASEDMPFQPAKEAMVTEIPQIPAYHDDSAISAGTLPAPKLDKARIQVSLPAARADKTLVVIQRRDELGRVVVPARSRPRRPVIEFLPDDQHTVETADIPSPANLEQLAAPIITDIPVAISASVHESTFTVDTPAAAIVAADQTAPDVDTTVASPATSLHVDAAVETPTVEQEPVSTAENPVAETQDAVPDIPMPAVATVHEPMMDAAPAMTYETEDARPVTSGTLQVNISLIQKVAVAAAIISLLVVAGLIANALFNPRAYDYGSTRPTPPATVPQQKADALSSAAALTATADTALQRSTVAK